MVYLVAKKGLYFLRGHIHLSLIRDRSIKNRVQVKGDDLDTALRYFKYTLVCHPEDWEAWYRLAQTYGTQVDEDMTWTADAINNHRKELVRKERVRKSILPPPLTFQFLANFLL